MAIATKVTFEEVAPTQAKFPWVRNLHKTVLVTSSGWVKMSLKNTLGAINVANMISATARFTTR